MIEIGLAETSLFVKMKGNIRLQYCVLTSFKPSEAIEIWI